MAEGRSNAGIAEALVLTVGAVEKHMQSILSKLDLPQATGDHRRVLAVLAYLRKSFPRGNGGGRRRALRSTNVRRYRTRTPPAQRASIGDLLRAWRQRRSLSQLELALEADVSSRHVSFLETGRARPSRDMVLRFAEHLDIPLRERNRLLLAAGYAPLYVERWLEEPEMAPVHQALDRFLRAHEPYPAVVIDRHHNLVSANDALGALIEGVAPELLEPPASALRVALHPDGMAPRVLNLPEWSAHLLHRLRREAALAADPGSSASMTSCPPTPGCAWSHRARRAPSTTSWFRCACRPPTGSWPSLARSRSSEARSTSRWMN